MLLPGPDSVVWVPLVSNLLALDQASVTTGWAFFQDGRLQKFGHFSYNDEDIGIRLTRIRDKVKTLCLDNNIDEVVYEDIQLQENVGNNVHTFKVLAEVYGVLTQLFDSLAIPARSYISTSWKSRLHIKGRTRAEQKRAAQAYVMDTYQAKCTQDEADAICIGASVLILEEEKQPFDWS